VTSPGAICTISFINDSVIKSLPPQKADSEGAAYWSWRPKDKDIELTEGSWTVEARATINGQAKTARDIIPLSVSP
jgi:hypothetical protein